MAGVDTTWSDPATALAGGGLDVATGDTLDASTYFDKLASDLNRLGGADGDCKTGRFIIGGTANTLNAAGLTINQGAADDEIITLKSSDVAHGMTASAETDTYGVLKKGNATGGGLALVGYSDGDDAFGLGLILKGISGVAASTTKSVAGIGVVDIQAGVKNGTAVADPGANGNLVSVRLASSGNARFILDSDGDSHQDVGTAWTNFDHDDDVALLTALSVGVSRPGDPIKEAFREYLEAHRETLERAKLVTFNEDNHHFINWSRTKMVMIGAIRQLADQNRMLLERLALMEQRLAMLPKAGG